MHSVHFIRERPVMRSVVVAALLALSPLALAETHQVTVNASSFVPQTLVVTPGDTVVWTLEASPPRSIQSGSSCSADSVFFDGFVPNSGGCGKCPPQNPTFTWEVPEYSYLEIPYFSGVLCDDGMTASLSSTPVATRSGSPKISPRLVKRSMPRKQKE